MELYTINWPNLFVLLLTWCHSHLDKFIFQDYFKQFDPNAASTKKTCSLFCSLKSAHCQLIVQAKRVAP